MNPVTLLPWQPPRPVIGARTSRQVRLATPTAAFWEAWRTNQAELVAAGVFLFRYESSAGWTSVGWLLEPGSTVEKSQNMVSQSKDESRGARLIGSEEAPALPGSFVLDAVGDIDPVSGEKSLIVPRTEPKATTPEVAASSFVPRLSRSQYQRSMEGVTP